MQEHIQHHIQYNTQYNIQHHIQYHMQHHMQHNIQSPCWFLKIGPCLYARALRTYGRAWEQMGTSCVEVGSSSMQNWGTGQQDDMTSALVAPGTSMSGSQLAGTLSPMKCQRRV